MPFLGGSAARGSLPADVEAGATPLKDLPGISAESQRPAGLGQSLSLDKSEQIQENLDNGNCVCSICTDTITESIASPADLYSCRHCYALFHLRCIEPWAKRSKSINRITLLRTWRCPNCQHDMDSQPEQSCWCGKKNNTRKCTDICSRAVACAHENEVFCTKTCHPGPCNTACGSVCEGLPPRKPTAFGKMVQRFKSYPAGQKVILLCLVTLFALIYLAFLIFLLNYWIPWKTMPYRYPDFSPHEPIVAQVCGLIIGTIVLGVVSCYMCGGWYKMIVHTFNFKSQSAKPMLLGCLLIALGFVLTVFPIISHFAGPAIAWDHQMRNSCNGFDQRISLAYSRAIKFPVHSARNASSKQDPFYLGTHFSPVPNNDSIPFQWSRRLTGESFDGYHIAVKVDTYHGLWELYHTSTEDKANQWATQRHKEDADIHISPKVPVFPRLNVTLLGKGTFSNTTKDNPHLHISSESGLNMSISNHWFFRDSFDQEAFLRVYNTSYLDVSDRKVLLDREWTPQEHTERMLMRSARFGSPESGLEICVREGQYYGEGARADGLVSVNGMRERMFIPLAIILSIRAEVDRYW